jgi:hypothetical protein
VPTRTSRRTTDAILLRRRPTVRTSGTFTSTVVTGWRWAGRCRRCVHMPTADPATTTATSGRATGRCLFRERWRWSKRSSARPPLNQTTTVNVNPGRGTTSSTIDVAGHRHRPARHGGPDEDDRRGYHLRDGWALALTGQLPHQLCLCLPRRGMDHDKAACGRPHQPAVLKSLRAFMRMIRTNETVGLLQHDDGEKAGVSGSVECGFGVIDAQLGRSGEAQTDAEGPVRAAGTGAEIDPYPGLQALHDDRFG